MKLELKNIYKNKYFIAIVIFILIILFFDDNNLIKRLSLGNEKQELESQIEFYEEEIKESNRKYLELKNDEKNLEKFAREEYFMKKKDEDIYIIVEKDDK